MKPDFSSASNSRRSHSGGIRPLSLAFACLSLLSGPARAETAAAAKPSGLLLVTNKGDQTLSIIDPATNRQTAVIPENGNTGHEVAASTDGKLAYVPIYGDSGVGKPGSDGTLMRIIDLQKQTITGTVDFGKGLRPHCPIVCAKTGLLYVTTEMENSVTVIDPRTQKILGAIPTGKAESHMLTVSHDGKRGYTANVESGTVSVLDLEARKLITTIPVAHRTQRIAVSPDDKLVFTADQVNPRIVVIDTATNTVKTHITLPDFGYGMSVTPDGKSLLVAMINTCQLGLVNLETMKFEKGIALPKSPQVVLVRPDGAMAYVSCDASAKVAAVDLKTWKVASLIEVGKVADGLAWAAASE
ncbi:MAG: YncE family protein [Verrucomicrobiota bacterium]